MNVFVLCSGRCGSKTFAKACGEIKNYTAGHETRTSYLGKDRFKYPDNHIEVDNRLAWLLGRLDCAYGQNAKYVHLLRDAEPTIASLERRANSGIVKRYGARKGVLLGAKNLTPRQIAEDFFWTVYENINLFLEHKPNRMVFAIEQAECDFPIFCKWINADVDMQAALAHFKRKYNVSKGS